MLMLPCPKEKDKIYDYHCSACVKLNKCKELEKYIAKLSSEETEENLSHRLIKAHMDACHRCKDFQIENLKASVKFWNDGWHEQRIATGAVAWEIPYPWCLSEQQQLLFIKRAEELIEYRKKNGTS